LKAFTRVKVFVSYSKHEVMGLSPPPPTKASGDVRKSIQS